MDSIQLEDSQAILLKAIDTFGKQIFPRGKHFHLGHPTRS